MRMNSAKVSILVVWLFTANIGWPTLGTAQVVSDDAEMARLRVKAEDAMGNDDPDGAAMMMGRAALMAAQLAKTQDDDKAGVYKRWESLFRSQEHVYRAIALFRRAGGQLPASTGVCGSLALAHVTLRHAIESTASGSESRPPRLAGDLAGLQESTDTWQTVIESLVAEYQCR
jgi:hypothetical protein